MNKIDKIAKKIVGFRNDINILKDIDEIIIIVTDQPISKFNFIASDNRNGIWSLKEIKQLVSMKNPRYEFLFRNDNLNRPERLGLTEQDCLNIIKDLNESDYDERLSNSFPNTNVYLKQGILNKLNNQTIDLYIKLSIIEKRKTRKVLIISFHEKGLI